MEKISGDTLDALFAAGAYRKAVEIGMSEKDAESFTLEVCKKAASKKIKWEDEDDEDDDDTWWNRNKGWLLPTVIGTGAFLFGADVGKNGRPDRNPFQNAGSLLMRRVRALLGYPEDPIYKSTTQVNPEPARGQ